MISQLLAPERVILDLEGDFARVLRRLADAAGLDTAVSGDLEALVAADGTALMAGDGIALPHLRLADLKAPIASLGLSRQAICHLGHRLQVILFLATPEQDSAGHLKLLQRMKALLPELREDLLRAQTSESALAILSWGEETSVRPTYFNLTQDQVAFELRTDLAAGLTSAEAEQRFGLHGPNRIRRTRGTPAIVKLLRNFFSFFAVLLWMAALMCFLPGVDMPQLGTAILVVVINGFFPTCRSSARAGRWKPCSNSAPASVG